MGGFNHPEKVWLKRKKGGKLSRKGDGSKLIKLGLKKDKGKNVERGYNYLNLAGKLKGRQ